MSPRSILSIRNCDVERVLIGRPTSHKHLRVILFLKDGNIIILHEATIANIVRAFVTIKTHPIIEAIELRGTYLRQRKAGYAEYQLLETNRSYKDISEEIDNIITGHE
ncbi:MAG: hypothetical protein DRZ82_04780 [Thermoprotei archaeon]|nr:MAG: hypothetical protein DRZ82_04780 [Thermoprotei archaeon]